MQPKSEEKTKSGNNPVLPHLSKKIKKIPSFASTQVSARKLGSSPSP
jgi:hypothetical protein